MLLQRFNMKGSNTVKVLIPVSVMLSIEQCPKIQEEEEDMSWVPYATAVGSLMYAMVCTRPDIAHAVGVLSKYMSKLGKKHWKAVKRVFRYLCGTIYYAICYQGRPRPDIVIMYMDLLMQTGLQTLITEDIQVGMCLTYLEELSIG